MTTGFLAIWTLGLGLVTATPTPDARELATALSPERLGLASGEATIAMELRDRAGRVVARTLRARMASHQGDKKMRLTFVAPADQRGVELLVLTPRGERPVQYLWLPRSSELRRVDPGRRGESFQGSDFSFSDFEERDLAQAEITLVGEAAIGGVAAYEIAITPRANEEAGAREWSRVEAWIAKDSGVALRVRFHRDGAPARQLDVKRLQKVDGRLMPTRLVMSDLARGTRTTLEITDLSPSARFPDAIFAPEALGR